MTNQDLLNLHVNEITKIKFSVLLSIARSEEPLTYTFIDSDKEYQIEVFFNSFSDEGLEMVVAMDSNWEGRFKSSDTTRVVTIRP